MSEIEQIPLGYVYDNDDTPSYPCRISHLARPFDWEVTLPFMSAEDNGGVERELEYCIEAGKLDDVLTSLRELIGALQEAATRLEAQR